MDAERWERIQSLFHEAVDLPETERRSFLQSRCGGDETLVGEVLALAQEDSRAASLLDQDMAQVAHRLIGKAPPAVPPSKQFGPYQIRRVLGEGGMGIVYLGERGDLGTLVAIKVLRDAWLSPSRRERFLNERRMLAQLNHPSIARLYDADALPDGTPWFVMEYVEGLALTDYCRRHGSSVRQRMELVRAVSEAVQYAHQNAVIHRDLKPSNILVRSDGKVRLLDFGIAKQLESLDVPAQRTLTGLRLMTPAYASPEQIRGERVDVQTDVYSLGIILYELLAGRLPFDLTNRTAAESEKILLNEEPKKPSVAALESEKGPVSNAAAPTARRSAWADLDVLCLTAMHKDVKRRYQSVEALIRDIDHFLKGEPLEARPDTVGYRMGKFVRRNHRAVAAAALSLALIVSLVVFFMVRLTKARNAALEETARTNRIQTFMLTLFQGGDADAVPAENLRVVTMLDRGVQEARSLSADPADQAELFETLGGIYEKLGKFQQADSLLRSALDERKSLYGPDDEEVAESLTSLALLRADQAKFAEAESLARQGLAMSLRHLSPNHPAVGKATFALGMVFEDRGAYAQAIPVFEKAVKIQSATAGDSRALAASLAELANTQFYAGHLDISEFLNQRVLAMHRRLYGDHHPLVADSMINLGAIEFERGHFDQAEQYDRQALAITRSWYGDNHPETASAMTILGRTLVSEHRYDEAESLLRQALAIQEHAYGPVHPRVASALNDLGRVALSRGKFDEAEADFSRMVVIYRSVYGEKHYLIGIALSNLGTVYLDEKNYPHAEKIIRQAVLIFTETLSPNHLNTGIARVKLGRALACERRYTEAVKESRAGYEILLKQASPPGKWMQWARTDLATEYEALHDPRAAEKYRTVSGGAAGGNQSASTRE